MSGWSWHTGARRGKGRGGAEEQATHLRKGRGGDQSKSDPKRVFQSRRNLDADEEERVGGDSRWLQVGEAGVLTRAGRSQGRCHYQGREMLEAREGPQAQASVTRSLGRKPGDGPFSHDGGLFPFRLPPGF